MGWKDFFTKTVMRKALPPRVAVLRLQGAIASSGTKSLSLQRCDKPLKDAFKRDDIKAVALVINSPGGSPTQSSLIYKRIKQLSEEKDIPVYAFVEDTAASGGYYLACAAEEIYANENSMIGSIGVIWPSFGAVDLIQKLGLERRVYTAGSQKLKADPFSPMKDQDSEFIQKLLEQIHINFKKVVVEARGKKIEKARKDDTPDLYDGAVWLAEEAANYGLIDGIGDLHSVTKAKFGKDVELVYVNPAGSIWHRMANASAMTPSGLIRAALDTSAEAQANQFEQAADAIVEALDQRLMAASTKPSPWA